MSTATKPHTFTPSTDIKSSEVNADLDTLYTYVNGEVIVRDASKAFTNHPSGPLVDPTLGAQYINKAFYDKGAKQLSIQTKTSDSTQAGAVSGVEYGISGFAINNYDVLAGRIYRIEVNLPNVATFAGICQVSCAIFVNGTKWTGDQAIQQSYVLGTGLHCFKQWTQGANATLSFSCTLTQKDGTAHDLTAFASATMPIQMVLSQVAS